MKKFNQFLEEKYMRFPEGKCKALTFSYDDGVSADIRLLKTFEKYGLKGTFNLNSERFDCQEWHDRLNEQETFDTFKDCGQEIALHGARHVFLTKVPLAEAVKEIVDNRAYLEAKFGKIVRGMAYAYSSFNADIKRVLKDLGVAYARTTVSTGDFSLPEDFLEWNPTCHHTDPEMKGICDKFFNSSPLTEGKMRESRLLYIWGHSYEFDDGNNWEIIEEIGKLATADDHVWNATNIQVYEYVTAYRNLVFSLDGERVYNPSAIPVWIELRRKTYKIDAGQTVAFDK